MHTLEPLGAPVEPEDALRRIAVLLERERAGTYRVEAFRKAMGTVRELGPEAVARHASEGTLQTVPAGLRSSCTYAGATTLEEFTERAVVGIQSTAGYAEGRPLHTSW